MKHSRNLILTIGLYLFALTASAQNGQLVADGNSADTYKLMRNCGYNHECPDSSREHFGKHFQHIQQTFDKDLGKNVFVFYIHAGIDDDRGKANINDRQRNEIKTDGKSPKELVAQEGETMVYKWKFKLPKGFVTTSKFSHIHQLKGLDNKEKNADVGQPLMTFTCYTQSNGKQVMRLRYNNRATGETETLEKTPLDDFIDSWVEVEETVKYGAEGAYCVTIKRVKDGKVLLDYKNDKLDMWRTGTTGLRPKWGIYRYLGKNREWQSQLRDEEIRFADFSIEKTNCNSCKKKECKKQ